MTISHPLGSDSDSDIGAFKDPRSDPVFGVLAHGVKGMARRRLLAMRDELAEDLRSANDRRISEHLLGLLGRVLDLDHPPCKIGGYWPVRSEPDLRPLYMELSRAGHRIGLPLIEERKLPLAFVLWKPYSAMASGKFGIPVPTSGKAVHVELLLMPCVGFYIAPDGQRYRLGYGGGYYDRTLAARRIKTIGVAYAAARLETFEPAPHDVPLDHIVTEEGVF